MRMPLSTDPELSGRHIDAMTNITLCPESRVEERGECKDVHHSVLPRCSVWWRNPSCIFSSPVPPTPSPLSDPPSLSPSSPRPGVTCTAAQQFRSHHFAPPGTASMDPTPRALSRVMMILDRSWSVLFHEQHQEPCVEGGQYMS